MKNSQLIHQLITVGLDERQARVYLAALALGGGTVTAIAQEANLERTACYYYVKELTRLRLLTKGSQAKNTYYPADPTRLQRIMREKQQALEGAMPAITALFSQTPNRSQILYFEGEDGITELYRQMETIMEQMSADEYVYAFSRLFEAMMVMPDFLTSFFERRSKMAAQSMTILPLSERPSSRVLQGMVHQEKIRHGSLIANKRYLSDRYMPTGMSTIMIARDQVAIVDFKSLFGTITSSASLAQTWTGFHQYIWSTLPEMN